MTWLFCTGVHGSTCYFRIIVAPATDICRPCLVSCISASRFIYPGLFQTYPSYGASMFISLPDIANLFPNTMLDRPLCIQFLLCPRKQVFASTTGNSTTLISWSLTPTVGESMVSDSHLFFSLSSSDRYLPSMNYTGLGRVLFIQARNIPYSVY